MDSASPAHTWRAAAVVPAAPGAVPMRARAPHESLVIAVDGPSGAGKSSVARGVAGRLGLRYLDTGSTYRALTWHLLRCRVDVSDPAAIARCAGAPALTVRTDPGAPGVAVDGVDVTRAIRTAEVTAAVSPVSAVPAVRARLVELQRGIIGSGGIVVEGRDIGTVVAPDAAVKVYLTATARARAARRGAELAADPASTLVDLTRRDRLDSTRASAPLACAADAHEIDATSLTLEQVIDAVLALVAGLGCADHAPPAPAPDSPARLAPAGAVVLAEPVGSREPA